MHSNTKRRPYGRPTLESGPHVGKQNSETVSMASVLHPIRFPLGAVTEILLERGGKVPVILGWAGRGERELGCRRMDEVIKVKNNGCYA